MTSLIRLPVPSSMPFMRLTSVASGRSRRRDPLGEVAAQRLRRHRDGDHVGPVEGDRRVGRRGDASGSIASAGSRGCAAPRDALGHVLAPGPDHDRAAGVGEHLGERRAPGAGARARPRA
jgi:hypothetical protein